ncbi:hypothetical protein HFP57_07480 [Parasphingopyxis algicola]|uniref:hypothetical protein n=1 Tax=Parasphingopyxis algicola TaxID=2026624 RepID=UPI0015A2169B|nr:hypothetical protein [Parasphingopyxis algicola]QLC24884.1 hypothetical protein HFP57_07480 [Parasphingopyxis algicola]
MYNFDAASIPVLSEDTRRAIAAADDALLTNTQMFASILQTAKTADLPINVTQNLYSNMVEGAVKFLEGREQIQQSVRIMQAIAKRSPHGPKMEGCPLGFPSRLSGMKSDEAVAAKSTFDLDPSSVD